MNNDFIIIGINRIVMVGKEEYPEKQVSFSGDLSWNELIFTFSGHATIYYGDFVLEDTPDSIRFLPKGLSPRYDVEFHEHGECIDICFQTDSPVADSAFNMSVVKKEKIRALFQKIFACWVSKEDGYYFECISLLYKILAELQKVDIIPKKHFQKIKPAIDAIHNGFLQKKFSTDQLSSLCGIGESYFKRLFKEKYGTPPKKYIIQLKLNHACELLRLERYSVAQIAEICNFSDVYLFSRQFKEYIGLSPTKFVKKYRSSK